MTLVHRSSLAHSLRPRGMVPTDTLEGWTYSDNNYFYVRADDYQSTVREWADYADALLAELVRERDLAIAHDTQPYPTADAYDKVCAANEKQRLRIAELEAELLKAVQR